MYLCQSIYRPWHGQGPDVTIFKVVKTCPSKDYFMRGGHIVPHIRNTKLENGTSVLVRYAKIGNKLSWTYPKD